MFQMKCEDKLTFWAQIFYMDVYPCSFLCWQLRLETSLLRSITTTPICPCWGRLFRTRQRKCWRKCRNTTNSTCINFCLTHLSFKLCTLSQEILGYKEFYYSNLYKFIYVLETCLVKILNRRVKLNLFKDFIHIVNVLFRKPVLLKFNIMY